MARFGNVNPVHGCAVLFAFLFGSALAFAGCSKSPTEATPIQGASIEQFLSGANAMGLASVRVDGSPPAPSGGPAGLPTGMGAGTAGGTSLVFLQGNAPFQTVFVSLGSAQTARDQRAEPSAQLTATLLQLFEAPLLAAVVHPGGFHRLDLTSPVTDLPLTVSYNSSVNGSLDLRFQLASASGAVGPIATLPRNVNGTAISLVGIVYSRWIGTPGPSSPAPDPVAGAVVSTSLSSQTATTDGNGFFELHTGSSSSSCYTLTIARAGLPTFSASRKFGSGDIVRYTLASTPQFPIMPPCS